MYAPGYEYILNETLTLMLPEEGRSGHELAFSKSLKH